MSSYKMIYDRSGFSLIELMVAIAVVGILSAITIPNIIGWREDTKIRNVSRSLVADLQYGKTIAIRENTRAVIVVTGGDYTICLDDNGNSKNDCLGADVLKTRGMPSGFSITNDFADDAIGFDGNGVAWFAPDGSPVDEEATITLTSPGGNTAEVNVNFLGRVRLVD